MPERRIQFCYFSGENSIQLLINQLIILFYYLKGFNGINQQLQH